MHESQRVASKFQTKDGLDSTIIVFVFLEIQSNNVPVPRCILNQINKTYTSISLGYEFFFSTPWSCGQTVIFFQSLIHLPQTKQKPWMLLGFFFITSFFNFSLGTVFMFMSEVIYSIPYRYHKHYNTKT